MKWFNTSLEDFDSIGTVVEIACCKTLTGVDWTGLDWTQSVIRKTLTHSMFYKSLTESVFYNHRKIVVTNWNKTQKTLLHVITIIATLVSYNESKCECNLCVVITFII